MDYTTADTREAAKPGADESSAHTEIQVMRNVEVSYCAEEFPVSIHAGERTGYEEYRVSARFL